jgi:sugar phosphate isomerase/epimerase
MTLACELPYPVVGDAAAYFDVVERCGLRGVSLKVQNASEANLLRKPAAKSASAEKDGQECPPYSEGPRLAVLDAGDDWQRHGQAWLDRAAECGARHLVIDAGRPSDEHRSEHLAAIRGLGQAAAERGITVCLDTLPGLCENSRAMAKTIKEIDHAAVRLCFDLGGYLWLNPEANAEIALQRLLGSIAVVRLRDFGVWSPSPVFPPLGNGGAVDFVLVLQVLRTSGFAGPCVISFAAKNRAATVRERGSGDDTKADCSRARLGNEEFAAQLRASVKHLRDCGWFDER